MFKHNDFQASVLEKQSLFYIYNGKHRNRIYHMKRSDTSYIFTHTWPTKTRTMPVILTNLWLNEVRISKWNIKFKITKYSIFLNICVFKSHVALFDDSHLIYAAIFLTYAAMSQNYFPISHSRADITSFLFCWSPLISCWQTSIIPVHCVTGPSNSYDILRVFILLYRRNGWLASLDNKTYENNILKHQHLLSALDWLGS